MGILLDNIKAIPQAAQNSVVAIGNFDGVHLGHRALLETAVRRAQELSSPAVMLTFEPHPRQFFQPGVQPFRLTFLPVKSRIAQDVGIARVVAFSFDATMAAMTADDFMRDILQQGFRAKEIVVGHDFHFGKNRGGNPSVLAQRFPVITLDPVCAKNTTIISSTQIRSCLAAGKFDEAEQLLGWRWFIEEEVVTGQQRGRTLGYPTANQMYQGYQAIPFGVYATEVQIEDEDIWRPAVSNFGIRPMFETAEPLMETHILDFAQDIYGKSMRLRIHKYLRSEQKFASLGDLTAQMKQDCLAARAVLESATF